MDKYDDSKITILIKRDEINQPIISVETLISHLGREFEIKVASTSSGLILIIDGFKGR